MARNQDGSLKHYPQPVAKSTQPTLEEISCELVSCKGEFARVQIEVICLNRNSNELLERCFLGCVN